MTRRRSPRPSTCSPVRVPDTGAQPGGALLRVPIEVPPGGAGLACRVTIRVVDDATRTPTSVPRRLEALALPVALPVGPDHAAAHGPRLVLLDPDVRALSGALSGQG